MRELVNPTERAFEKRKYAVRYVDGDVQVLCVNFAHTMQHKDILVRTDLTMDSKTQTYPYRFKIDNKALDPEERARKGLQPFDFSGEKPVVEKAVIEALGDHFSFDMPLWFARRAGADISNILHYDRALTFQSKGCNLHDWTMSGGCVYCYVDDVSNNPTRQENSVWLGVPNILTTALELREDATKRSRTGDRRELHRIRHSSGQTTTELDFTLRLLETIEQEGIEKLYVQFDTNLSTGKFMDEMIKRGEYQSDILEQLGSYGAFVYAAFKGTSDLNIRENTQADLTVEDQLYEFGKLVDANLEVYPCIYCPDPNTLPDFLDELKSRFNNASKLLRVEDVFMYGVTKERLKLMAQDKCIPGEKFTAEYEAKVRNNYEESEAIMRSFTRSDFALSYKKFDRTQYEITRKFDTSFIVETV